MDDVQLSRRRLMGAATATGFAAASGGLAFTGGLHPTRVGAQDAAATPEPLGPAIPEEFNTETNWPYENLDLSATRNAQGTSISSETVGQLGDAWSFPVSSTAAFGALTGNPTVVGDTLFVQDASANVYALNKETGEQLWANMYNDVVPSGGPNGIANAYGLVYTTIGGIGDVIALRAESGEEVWRTNIQGPLKEGITTAPLVYDNVVYVSTVPGSSEDFYIGGQRGIIHALDAASGEVLWYWDTNTDNLWGNPRVNSGGGFWHPPSVDEEGKLYIATGNAGPWPGTEEWPNATSRPGDNDYNNCILKMDPDTATLDWYLNVIPHDLFDRDNQLTPVLAEVDGRKVVFTSGKHSFVVCLDRESGEEIWRVPVGEHKNDDVTEIPEGESLEVVPIAGVETPMALADGKLFLPLWGLGIYVTPFGFDPEHPIDLAAPTGSLEAVNVTDGSIAWAVKLPTAILGGATVTNDVVFTAGLDGVIRGHSVTDGAEVFRYQASAGINTSPAVSGDTMFWAAGAALVPSPDTVSPAPEYVPQVIALKIGGATLEGSGLDAGEATPEG